MKNDRDPKGAVGGDAEFVCTFIYNGTQRPAQPANIRDQCFERDVGRLHALGARPTAELLREVGARIGCMTVIEALLARYADLDPGVVQALGGDRFPPAPIHVVNVSTGTDG